MPKLKITYNRENCIGAAACVVVADKFWSLSDIDSKADLKNATHNPTTGLYELVLDVDEATAATIRESADVCPVAVIHVEEVT